MATFTNQATLSYNNTITNSNVVTGEIVEVLSAAKSALRSTYRYGDSITYVLSLINSGATALTGINLSDNLGAYTLETLTLTPLTYVADSLRYYVNGVQQPAPTTVAGPPLTVTGITIPANGNAILVYEAAVNDYAPLTAGSVIENTAAISGDAISAPLTASASVTAENTAILSISKSICPETITENGQLTYTFVIQNTGNRAADATDNVIVTDTFNPILDPIAVTFNGIAWTSPANYAYDTATGLFQTVAGQITVPAASYSQDAATGQWTLDPGVAVLKVVGTV